MDTMNTPLTMTIKDTKMKLANVCNKSGLPPVILDLIIQGIYFEIHSIAEKQAQEEELAYAKMIKDAEENANAYDDNEDK